jgi:type I restriction enzyme S subunit
MDVRPGYKATEIGVLPAAWKTSRCADVCERILVGIVIRPAQYYVNHGVPAFRSANIREDGITDIDLVFISETSNTSLSKSQTKTGDVLTVRTGYPGTSAVVRAHHAGCNCIDILITRPTRELNSDWLCIWINSSFGKEQVLRSQGGLAQKHFNVGDMRNLVVALPPPHEQRAIAEALSDVDALLAGLDRLIAKKRVLKQAAMQQLLTGQTRLPGFQGEWEVKRLGELGTTYGGLTGKSKADFGAGTARYVTFMNVMSNTVIDDTLFESVCISPGENQSRVERGDLLFNGSSETPEEVALCSLVVSAVADLFLNSFCFGFRPREDAQTNGLFLTYFIRSAEGREIMKSLAQGSTRYNLSKKALLAAEVRVPRLSEQSAIAAVLSDMDAELAALEARRDKSRLLKQGMMQELLTGRTRLV